MLKKNKIFILFIFLIFLLTVLSVIGIMYWLLTGPFGPAKGLLMHGVIKGDATNVTVIIPMIYIKDKPFYEYVEIKKGWNYEIVETKYGKMLKLHTNAVRGSKIIFNGDKFYGFPVVELNNEIKIEPSKTISENTTIHGAEVIRVVNYTVPIYTSNNITLEISFTVYSGISLFEPIYKGKKYNGDRKDRIIAKGKGWITGNGTARIDMLTRKHWYEV
jgi:hypothetical protein